MLLPLEILTSCSALCSLGLSGPFSESAYAAAAAVVVLVVAVADEAVADAVAAVCESSGEFDVVV